MVEKENLRKLQMYIRHAIEETNMIFCLILTFITAGVWSRAMWGTAEDAFVWMMGAYAATAFTLGAWAAWLFT